MGYKNKWKDRVVRIVENRYQEDNEIPVSRKQRLYRSRKRWLDDRHRTGDIT